MTGDHTAREPGSPPIAVMFGKKSGAKRLNESSLRARKVKTNWRRILEGELQRHLDHSLTTFVRDLAEVIDCGLREGEAPARIAHVHDRAAIPIGEELALGLGQAYWGDITYCAIGQRYRHRLDNWRPHA